MRGPQCREAGRTARRPRRVLHCRQRKAEEMRRTSENTSDSSSHFTLRLGLGCSEPAVDRDGRQRRWCRSEMPAGAPQTPLHTQAGHREIRDRTSDAVREALDPCQE